VSGLRGLTLAVQFGCELAMLVALAYWGFAVRDGVGAWVLGIGAPLLPAIVWSALAASSPSIDWAGAPPLSRVRE
jgi:uncharacterized protein DUF2568